MANTCSRGSDIYRNICLSFQNYSHFTNTYVFKIYCSETHVSVGNLKLQTLQNIYSLLFSYASEFWVCPTETVRQDYVRNFRGCVLQRKI